MKKFNFLFALVTLVLSGISQSNDFKTIQIRFGGEFGANITNNTVKFQGNLIDKDTSGFITQLIPISVDFGLHKRLSFGVTVKPGKLLDGDTYEDNRTIHKSSVLQLIAGLKFYMVNQDRFNLYLDISGGSSKYTKDVTRHNGIINTNELTTWSGSNFNAGIGFNVFITDHIGFYIANHFNANNIKLKNLTANNNPFDLTDFEYRINGKGGSISFGIVGKF